MEKNEEDHQRDYTEKNKLKYMLQKTNMKELDI